MYFFNKNLFRFKWIQLNHETEKALWHAYVVQKTLP